MRQLSPYEQTQLARHGNSGTLPLGDQPVEYATQKAEFCGLVFSVSPAVLIPRIETEELVVLAIQIAGEKIVNATSQKPCVIVEVGTGSGAISIALAKHLFPFANKIRLTASDISPEALAVAQQNSATLLTEHDPEIRFFLSNLLENYPVSPTIDLLIANLPYIPSARIPELDRSVKDHEPVLALDGGPTGLTYIYRLLEEAMNKVAPQGVILLEVDETHSLADFAHFSDAYNFEVLTDSFGKNRFVIARRKTTSTVA